MIHRLIQSAMFGLLCLAIAACSNSGPKLGSDAPDKSTPSVEIVNLLFAEAAWPKYAEGTSSEPIRVPACHLTVLDKVEVPSKEEGVIEWLGVEVKDGEIVDPKDVHVHKRTDTKYKRIRLGDKVSKGQVFVILDDTRVMLKCVIAKANIEGAKQDLKAGEKGVIAATKILDIERKVGSGTSPQQIAVYEANLAKADAEQSSKDWTIKRTEGEEKEAREKLNCHFIRAPFDGEVLEFRKQVGEGVRATESVLLIQNTDRLGVEGSLEVQYVPKVKRGSEVFLEPSILESPLSVRSPHTSSKPIAAVAVAVVNGKQVVVSASEDGHVFVWNRDKVFGSWKHAGIVRAVAVTRPEVKQPLALTGCDDGKARLWSLASIEKMPMVTLDGHHEGGVQSVAFAPDGKNCVTADDRGDIFLWEVATGKKRYQFPREHNSTVTSLHFTPQCRVVSVGRDKAVIVWKVGDKSPAKETAYDHRSGEVNTLGVSDDGGQMLIDLDKNRLSVIDVGGHRNLGGLEKPGEGKFSSFALISPRIGTDGDNRVILTSGGAEGVMQIWRWSAETRRGSQWHKLVTDKYVGATCAAFSPIAKEGFIVAGTRKGDVHLWPMPDENKLASRYTARITHVDPNLESNGKTVRVYAEFTNVADERLRLRPGTTTTMAIPQK